MYNKIITIGAVLVFLIVGLSGCLDLGEVTNFSITSFNVEPSMINEGETANLSWVVMSAETVSIDHGIGNVSNIGERIILPTENTTYTLTAKNGTKTLTATTQIIVLEESEDDNENSEDDDTETTPSITFTKDESENTLTVVASDSGVLWSNINMSANDDNNYHYDIGLSGYVTAGDSIEFDGKGLSGDITIMFRYNPTNSLIGTYKLNDVSSDYPYNDSEPSITFMKDESENTLTVVAADSGILWTAVNISATDFSTYYYKTDLSGYVTTGDLLEFDGKGLDGDITIFIRYDPTNSLIGSYKLDNVLSIIGCIAEINTSKGIIKIELYSDKLPKTCENFIKLANEGFYDGMIFHRVQDDFMIQAGYMYPDGSTEVSPLWKYSL